MNQNDFPQQQTADPSGTGVDQHGQAFSSYNEPVYPQQQWPQQMQQGVDTPLQQPQVSSGGASPEVPARIEQPEPFVPTEAVTEAEKSKEGVREEKTEKEKDKSEEKVESIPDQKKFESPFRVYGYQASQKSIAKSRKSSSLKVRGNPSFAKTWLIVLLGRLLRM